MKGMHTTMKRKTQKNSLLARPRRSKYKILYGAACFLLLYSLLLRVGARLFFVAGILCEDGRKWPAFLIVGLIILASSLLSRMFQNWLREIRAGTCDDDNCGDSGGGWEEGEE